MHELSLIASLFEILETQKEKEGFKKIIAVQLRCGLLSGVVPECLQTAFEIYKKDTLASEARLILEVVPVKFKCRFCGQIETAQDFPLICSQCQRSEVEILEGTELTLISLEVEG
ncbi:MAG: hydrogenase maturation nickel metallochaperone HypA [Candidatus Aminicenantes bacterium]|nr:hydrogenase maturation nickel metallochaperone HypA [Candidatus Aminicenantes bacterium]